MHRIIVTRCNQSCLDLTSSARDILGIFVQFQINMVQWLEMNIPSDKKASHLMIYL